MARSLFPLIAKRLDSIPTLPLTLERVLAATANPDQNPGDVIALVEADPAFTAKILKIINSPFYGLRFKISTLPHAVAMLGPATVRNIARGMASFPDRRNARTVLDKERFWVHSLATAAASRAIAQEVGYDLPEEAFIAGLLHDIGKVILDTYVPTEFARCVEAIQDDVGLVVDLERRHLGMDHARVGALLAEQWSLPKNLKDAIRLHHEESGRLTNLPPKHRELVEIVAAADRLCWAFGYGSIGDGILPRDTLDLPGGESIALDQVERILDQIQAEFERVGQRLGVSAVPDPGFLAALRKVNAGAADRLTAAPRRPSVFSRMSAITEVLRRTRNYDRVDKIIDTALSATRKGLGFDRVLLLEVDQEEDRLRGRRLYDETHIDVDVHRIDLPLNLEGPVATCLDDGAAHRVDCRDADPDLLSYLGVVEVAVVPVAVNDEPRWLICGDYFFNNREVTDTDVALFSVLGSQLGLTLENLVLARQADKLQGLALKDDLTGISNRRNLVKLLQREIDRAKRYRSPLSVVMVDIDHFKMFNDTYGHQAGDIVLTEVAQLIMAASRDIDVIGRYGGEEFLAVLPETEVSQAIVYAERLRSTVEGFGKERQKTYPRCQVTISIGVSALQPDRDDIERVIHRVDRALYAAKDRGRNRVCVD
jgi:diguanylate cyclase (GGDEF)-like protein/putative nucleotidyltransferase with HDIG domain